MHFTSDQQIEENGCEFISMQNASDSTYTLCFCHRRDGHTIKEAEHICCVTTDDEGKKVDEKMTVVLKHNISILE